jgi:hypothetical protein
LSYYREDEVARLIQNWARWRGDGASVRGCGSSWLNADMANTRDARKSWRSALILPTLGIDAARTAAALAAMRENHARALKTFHLSAVTFEMQAKGLRDFEVALPPPVDRGAPVVHGGLRIRVALRGAARGRARRGDPEEHGEAGDRRPA